MTRNGHEYKRQEIFIHVYSITMAADTLGDRCGFQVPDDHGCDSTSPLHDDAYLLLIAMGLVELCREYAQPMAHHEIVIPGHVLDALAQLDPKAVLYKVKRDFGVRVHLHFVCWLGLKLLVKIGQHVERLVWACLLGKCLSCLVFISVHTCVFLYPTQLLD
jgi:hypothetical protein